MAKVSDADERPAEPVGERRQPVDDHHRTFVERGLHRDRPRRDERDVGRRSTSSACPSSDDRRGAPGNRAPAARAVVGEVRRAGDDELHAGQPAADAARRRARGRAESPALRCGGCPAAARRPALAADSPGRASERSLRLRRRHDVEQRMPDPLHRHAGVPVDLFLERERSRARGRQCARIVFIRPGRHAQSCGLM